MPSCWRTYEVTTTNVRRAMQAIAAMLAATTLSAQPRPVATAVSSWNATAAAAYLDGREAWWLTWPTAARDHNTSCVSCHTALPYALARPALRAALGERAQPEPERRLVENVVKRVQQWRDVDPFYPDQTRVLAKPSES